MTAIGPAVGQSVERADGRLKLSGQAEYTGDLRLPGMLYGAVLHSPVAHARIRSIDTSAAQQADGVVVVLTGDDLSDIDPYYGHALRTRPVVALGKVRFLGEPVAVVAAESQAAADARSRSSPSVRRTPDRGLPRDGARPGRPAGPREAGPAGQRARSWRPARRRRQHLLQLLVPPRRDQPRLRRRRRGPRGRVHLPGRLPVLDGDAHHDRALARGDLTLWSSCQHPFLVRQEIAALFGLPLDQVRIIVPFLGGGFGSKSYTKMEPLTAAIARKAGRAVRILNAVHESMITTRRHNMTARMRTAAAADGTLLGRECQAWRDTGAYADNGPGSPPR
jgi:CO/xanthine dehydrogenase Mo-binding subunit